MDIEKIMVLIKGEDKTDSIIDIVLDVSGRKVQVTYSGGRSYFYNTNNVVVLENPKSISLNGKVAYVKGLPVYEPRLILDFKNYIRIIQKNDTFQTIRSEELSLVEDGSSSETAQQTLTYLREISQYTADDLAEEAFLKREMDQLTFVHSESVLGRYLNQQSVESRTPSMNGIIFPFRFNLSQKVALENALTHSMSVIEGPPGTGKTQTILNILANLIIQGKTVAVTSNNNEAVKNVIEKMTKKGYGFLTALLGKKTNQDAFFADLPRPHVDEWDCTEKKEELVQNIESLNVRLNELLKIDRKRAQLKQELQAWQLEQEHFNEYYSRQDVVEIGKLPMLRANSDRIISFLAETSLAKEREYTEKLMYRLKMLIKYRGSFRKLQQQETSVLLLLERAFYQKQIQKLEKAVAALDNQLDGASFDALLEQHQQYSEKLFRKCLYESHSVLPKGDFTKKNFKARFGRFVETYPIILSTTHALRRSIPQNYLLDYVIIDEASQVDLITGVLAFSCCRNVIVVGDVKQLPQITDAKIESKLKKAPPGPVYNYFKHSILSSMIGLYGDNLPREILREHYRCHPQIIQFCNQKYYGGELIPYTNSDLSQTPLVLYKTAEGNHMRRVTKGEKQGTYNQRELDVTVEEILKNSDLEAENSQIGFVTPYRKQANVAGSLMPDGIESDTVHKYQGREKDVMILSTVLDSSWQGQRSLNFVDDPHMVNVAVSRAIKQFVLVTDHDLFYKKGKDIGDLIRYMQYSTLDENVIESRVVSIFDLLYKQYSRKLLPLKAKMDSEACYQSEEALRVLLEEILIQPEYKRFSYTRGVLLRNLINSVDLLMDEELAYVNNRASLDFVVYYKQDKSCKFVIEVDGFAFHENKPEQLKRDALKNSILKKYEIPLLRLATNGSGERERIMQALE
ncbi:MAG: AAA family ATPase [Clostridiales bacterium]|jgi:hypothetical protein|nr:AAA family ATPase [Clostridiales bacterium]